MHEMQFYCGETIKFIFKSQIGRIHLRGANKIASARDNVITMTISHTKKYFYVCTYKEMSLFYNVNFLGFFYTGSYQLASFEQADFQWYSSYEIPVAWQHW